MTLRWADLVDPDSDIDSQATTLQMDGADTDTDITASMDSIAMQADESSLFEFRTMQVLIRCFDIMCGSAWLL